MTLDETTIIIGSITLLLAVAAPFFSPFFRFRTIFKERWQRPGNDVESVSDRQDNSNMPEAGQVVADIQQADEPTAVAITVLLTVHEQAKELEAHLPAFLDQQYRGDFQVVVVVEQGDGAAEDVLKRHAGSPHLYSTFIPRTSRYMSRRKLAVTLGVKAAAHEWIIMTDICCVPSSPFWLEKMSAGCGDNKNLVLGYSNYDDATPSSRRINQLYTGLYLLQKAQKGTAYRTNMANLMFRKSQFIEEEGYRGNLHLLRGEYDFIVNKYARPDSSSIVIAPEAWTVENVPEQKTWFNKQLFYQQTRRALHRSAATRALFNLDMFMLHITNVAIILSIIYGLFTINYLLCAIAFVSLVLTWMLRVQIAKKIFRNLLHDVPVWKLIPFELNVIWQNLLYNIRFRHTDKTEFTSHKV